MDDKFDMKVELDLPQIDTRDDEELMALALWALDFERQHGRYPDHAEMHAWVEAHRAHP